MEHKGIVSAVIVLIIIVIGMFLFAYFKKTEIQNEIPYIPPINEEVSYPEITRVDAKHFYIDGTHTIVGEILFPTPCDLLNWDVAVAESYPEQVAIDFTVINNSETCVEMVTPQRFKISFDASEDADIQVQFEGRQLELNLIPGSEGESPDDFELFIKG